MKLLQYLLKDDGQFPNSIYPVLLYKQALRLHFLFKGVFVKNFFKKHHWTNNWRDGVYTFHHYHSNTHEVMAVIQGSTRLKLGGENGIEVEIEKKGICCLYPPEWLTVILAKRKMLFALADIPAPEIMI